MTKTADGSATTAAAVVRIGKTKPFYAISEFYSVCMNL